MGDARDTFNPAEISSAPPDNVLKCRHCSYTTFKWRTGVGGKKQSGWRNLQEHMFDAHDIEVDLIGQDDE